MFIACDSFWLRVAPVTVVSVASLSQDGRVGEAVKDEVQDWCKGEKKTEVLFFLLSASWKREREKSFASFRTMWPRHGYGHQRGRPRFCNDADGHAATEKKWVMKDPPSENVKKKDEDRTRWEISSRFCGWQASWPRLAAVSPTHLRRHFSCILTATTNTLQRSCLQRINSMKNVARLAGFVITLTKARVH